MAQLAAKHARLASLRIAPHLGTRTRAFPTSTSIAGSTQGGASPAAAVSPGAISAVFTIGYVANQLGEDADWLFDLSIDMFPEDGCLWVYGVGEDGVPAFTEYGIECLRQIIADERAAGRAPLQTQPPK